MNDEKDKIVYFVRHGETPANLTNDYYNESNDVLTEHGIKQAELLAERCSRLTIDCILSSDLNRARQTADIINDKIQKPIEYFPVLRETALPTKVSYESDAWRFVYSEKESFEDRKNRAKLILELILSRLETHLLMVVHAGVIKTVIPRMMLGEGLTPFFYEQFVPFTSVTNTGITVCKYIAAEERWKLVTFNDRAHL
ncbi:MAG: histidine phosphatase family protein [Candidatus Ryanbacteria bacterium]|nr:histidine phosphatase family protein [Candidatus Ryanbacteria bacterium]